MKSTTGRRPRSAETGSLLLLLGLTCLCYANSLRVPFVYDDSLTILEDPSVRLQLPLTSVVQLNPFRPLLVFSFLLNYRYAGLNPLSYHIVNCLMHFFNGALLFLLLRRLLPRPTERPARLYILLAASIAIAHPLFTESVTYISSRSTLQATVFVLLSLHLYLSFCEGGRIWLWAGSLLAFLCAAATKEIGAVAPLLMALLVLSRHPRLRRAWLGLVPFGVLFGLAASYRAYVFFRIEYTALPRSIASSVLTQLAAFPSYVKLFVVPWGLTIAHDFPTAPQLMSQGPLVGLCLVAAAAGAVVWSWKRRPLAALLLAFVIVSHLPSSGVFPLQEAFTEHRFYLQGLWLCALASLPALAGALRLRAVWAVVVTTIVVCFSGMTIARNRVWQSEEALWLDAVTKQPTSARALSNYADCLRLKGDYRSAAGFYVRALESAPGNLDYTVNLGISLASAGQATEAESVFQAARKIDPRSPKPLVNLGNLCAMRRDYACARELWEEAIILAPGSYEARVNLARLYRDVLGDREKYEMLLEEARRVDPVRALDDQ